jgi:hypothetical protein
MVLPEEGCRGVVIPSRDGTQGDLNLVILGDIASGQQRERAQAQGAFEHIAPLDARQERLIFVKHALVDAGVGPKQ